MLKTVQKSLPGLPDVLPAHLSLFQPASQRLCWGLTVNWAESQHMWTTRWCCHREPLPRRCWRASNGQYSQTTSSPPTARPACTWSGAMSSRGDSVWTPLLVKQPSGLTSDVTQVELWQRLCSPGNLTISKVRRSDSMVYNVERIIRSTELRVHKVNVSIRGESRCSRERRFLCRFVKYSDFFFFPSYNLHILSLENI